MRRCTLILAAIAAGCETPCTDLNASLVALYEDCGLDLPADLEDGGEGDCAISDEEADCEEACYDAGGCPALDGSDEAAAEALATCLLDCEEAG